MLRISKVISVTKNLASKICNAWLIEGYATTFPWMYIVGPIETPCIIKYDKTVFTSSECTEISSIQGLNISSRKFQFQLDTHVPDYSYGEK